VTPIVLTHSDVESFLQCRRRFAWAYISDLSPVDRVWGDLPLGSRVHKAIEGLYDGEDAVKLHDKHARLDLEALELDGSRPPWALDQLYRDIIVGRNCVTSYLEFLDAGGDRGLEVVGNEKMVEVPFCDGAVILRGKIDRIFRRVDDDGVIIDDLKTSSVWRTGLRERLERSYQPAVYAVIERLLNPDFYVAGAQFSVIKKVSNKRRVKDALVERFAVPGFASVIDTKMRQLERICREIIRLIEDVQREGHLVAAFPSPADHCRYCAFRFPCELTDESPAAAEALLDAEFRRGVKHARYDERVLGDVVS
jgi:RecB family exonuclease